MAVEPRSEAQWLREGWTPEEISTFSKLGLVLANTGADALNEAQKTLIVEAASVISSGVRKMNSRQLFRMLVSLMVDVIEAGDS